MQGRARALRHGSLAPASGWPLATVRDRGLGDQLRLAVVLQGAALLGHLHHSGWYLPMGWEGAAVDADGRLTGCQAMRGAAHRLPQEWLCVLVELLFGAGEVVGRGESRRVLRDLLPRWRQELVAIDPDEVVAALLDSAPRLWEPWAAPARQSLVAEVATAATAPGGEAEGSGAPRVAVVAEAVGEPWAVRLALPRSRRRALLRRAADASSLAALLAGPEAQALLARRRDAASAPGVADAAEPRAAEAPPGAEDPLAWAPPEVRQGLADGHFAAVRAELARLAPCPRTRVALLVAQQQLGELVAARATLRALADDLDRTPRELAGEAILTVGEIALRLALQANEPAAVPGWLERTARALQAAVGERGGREVPAAWLARLAILEAEAAYDTGQPQAMSEPLERAAPARSDPEVAWRWANARGLQANALGDPAGACEAFVAALRLGLRRLPRWRAARLWNELGTARLLAGDLAGCERAMAHAAQKLATSDGQALVTLALPNLAETRLRRGRLVGVEAILERTRRENERSGNRRALGWDRELEVRHLLLTGRLATALARCRELLAGGQAEHGRPEVLALFAARALGWLGRTAEARAALEGLEGDVLSELEPEERPAVWAHAGCLPEAWREAERARFGGLWQALLSGRRASPAEWDALEALEPYRAARLVLDAELASPGLVPPRWLRRAVAALRYVGAGDLAMRLEAASVDPWTAVAGYLGRGRAGGEELAALFAACGHGDVRLWWQGERRDEVLVDGPGGSEELVAPHCGGALVLRAAVLAPPLRVLFQLVRRDWAPTPDLPAEQARVEGPLLGGSSAMHEVRSRVARLAGSDLPVLVLGETGTGKELVAQEVHRQSRRASAPFLPVNCAALTEGVLQSELFGHVRGAFTGAERDRAGIFETARGGTVFLDEIGDLPLGLQGSLLRLLQSGEVRRVGESVARKVDVRIVAATHRDLAAMAAQGTFREDLFYRLRYGVVQLPPLRERGDDVLELAGMVLRRMAKTGRVVRLSPSARAALVAHRWPGNVRELVQVLETAAVLADGTIEPNHLELPQEAARPTPAGDYHARVERFRRELLQEAIAAAGGNLAEAARRLGLSRQALSYLAKELGLDRGKR
jgi:DNA-binding NtrC family response regulator